MVKFFTRLRKIRRNISFCKNLSPGNLKKTKSTEIMADENGDEEQSLEKGPVLYFVSGEPKTKSISASHSEALRSTKRTRRCSGTRNTCQKQGLYCQLQACVCQSLSCIPLILQLPSSKRPSPENTGKLRTFFFLTHTRLTYTKHTQCCLKEQQKQKSLPLVYNLLLAEKIIDQHHTYQEILQNIMVCAL